jgi:putative chitinase
MIEVRLTHIAQLAPRGANRRLFANADEVLFDYCISDTPLRLAHFFAQVLHETNGLTRLTEDLDQPAERLLKVWPDRFRNIAHARRFAHNPMALANKLYDNRLGNRHAGDGWRFAGRGLLQIAGRAMYERISQRLDVDLVTNPDLVTTEEWALPAACEVWRAANGNALADRNDVLHLTRAISGGNYGLTSRRNWLAKTREVWPQEH